MLLDPRLSACIVLYKSGARAIDAVRCIQASTIPVDLHIVDNSPGEVTARGIRAIAPEYPIHPQRTNRGYAGGNNAVLPLIHSTYHLIMNPDVVFEPDLLQRMVAYMDAHPDIVILTPRVFSENGEEQFLPRMQPTLRSLLSGPLESRFAFAARWRDAYTMRGQELDGPMQVQFATGCFLMIRTHMLFQLKGFDEQFFLYHEDSDLSRRAMKLGPIVYNPDFCVTHAWTRASHGSRAAAWEHIKSTVKFFRKWGWTW